MDRYGGNYEAVKAMHEARMQQVRASADAADFGGRHESDVGLVRRLGRWLASLAHHGQAPPGVSADRFFWT